VSEERLDRAIDAMTNALQTAVLLAGGLRASVGAAAQDAADLEAALKRAVHALQTLQPPR
jgi:hypothetical protein